MITAIWRWKYRTQLVVSKDKGQGWGWELSSIVPRISVVVELFSVLILGVVAQIYTLCD